MSEKQSKNKVKSLVIKRSEWLRGFDSRLLEVDSGKKCCLGFYAIACGYSEKEISDYGSPSNLLEIDNVPNLFPEWLVPSRENRLNSSPAANLININDMNNDVLGDKERESIIKEIFSNHGVKVTFVD